MYRVLIVEDDPMVAMINEQYVNRNNDFKVIGKCRSGKAALEYLEDNEADLLVMDIYMPQVDGLTALREIRNRHIQIAAIMVTAANDRNSLDDALQLGVIDYLVKPFTFERFKIALDKFIAQTTALRDLETLNQKNIYFILGRSRQKAEEIHPKGIQESTLRIIIGYLETHTGEWLTGDEIAANVALTGVTVRRYLNYLTETGAAVSRTNYETGGRPCMLYMIPER